MILKCAQHISLPERSHPPKLIKNYIAISCLIKETLCSENPAQLSNGCYSMKTGRVCLRERHKIHTRTQTKHITFPVARGDWRRPRSVEMEKVWIVWSWKRQDYTTECQIALPSLRFHMDCRIGSDSDERGLIATFCVVTSTASSWTWIAADVWRILRRFSLGDLPIHRLLNLQLERVNAYVRARRTANLTQMFPKAAWKVEAPPVAGYLVYLLAWECASKGLSCD